MCLICFVPKVVGFLPMEERLVFVSFGLFVSANSLLVIVAVLLLLLTTLVCDTPLFVSPNALLVIFTIHCCWQPFPCFCQPLWLCHPFDCVTHHIVGHCYNAYIVVNNPFLVSVTPLIVSPNILLVIVTILTLLFTTLSLFLSPFCFCHPRALLVIVTVCVTPRHCWLLLQYFYCC